MSLRGWAQGYGVQLFPRQDLYILWPPKSVVLYPYSGRHPMFPAVLNEVHLLILNTRTRAAH